MHAVGTKKDSPSQILYERTPARLFRSFILSRTTQRLCRLSPKLFPRHFHEEKEVFIYITMNFFSPAYIAAHAYFYIYLVNWFNALNICVRCRFIRRISCVVLWSRCNLVNCVLRKKNRYRRLAPWRPRRSKRFSWVKATASTYLC